jgi:transcriptional regulator with GAF, ATPase, and Fis domain
MIRPWLHNFRQSGLLRPWELPLKITHLLQLALSRRGLLVSAGVFVCCYALAVLDYVYLRPMPMLDIRSAFSTKILIDPPPSPDPPAQQPQRGDTVLRVGNLPVRTWPDLLNAPQRLRSRIDRGESDPTWFRKEGEIERVAVDFERPDPEGTAARRFTSWRVLGGLPVEELVPTVLWGAVKFLLFAIGALVWWKRPADRSAAQFFLLCVVTLGAFTGGYNWAHIATQPALLLVFMTCSVLLPAVTLHFYLVFPRAKPWLLHRPGWTLATVYGVPLTFLVALAGLYAHARWLAQFQQAPVEATTTVLGAAGFAAATAPFYQAIEGALDRLQVAIFAYIGIAPFWYLASVLALLHSYRRAADAAERNQVKCILGGAVLAALPIGYSVYVAVFEPARFGAGAVTWPMFAASLCMTVAFAVSITQYRLMELDKVLSSGVLYFIISLFVGLAYSAVVFVGTLLFQHTQGGPELLQALYVSATALLVLLVLDLARSRIIKALDRRVSRQKHQLDKTLQRMGQTIAQLVDPATLANRLLQTSTELLGAHRGAVYLRQGEQNLYQLADHLGDAPPLTELSSGCPLVEALADGDVVTARTKANVAPSPAQRQLRLLGGEVAQALAHEGRLLALLVLGAREGGPYRPEDLNLLSAFGQITVLALGSAAGHRTIEQLNRELQAKVEKISEQQRRILTLQSQLHRQNAAPADGESADGEAPTVPAEGVPGIVGSSPQVRQLLHLVRKVSATEAVVLIRGESGTGKGLLARALHEHSPRAAKPFVQVHCAALSPTLLESELFGHVKGAFTNALRDKVGRFELAHGGTLFLDEIGDISLDVQTKLLRVLQERTFERVGSSDPVQADVRILTATHQDLEHLIRAGRFREDLYYRLNVFPISVPALREHLEDIAELAQHFLQEYCRRCKKAIAQIDDDALAALKAYSWPGNVRELENAIQHAVVNAEGPVVTVRELPPAVLRGSGDEGAAVEQIGSESVYPGVRRERQERDRRERELLVRALAAANGNKAEAARALGMARSTLVSRLKKHGLS